MENKPSNEPIIGFYAIMGLVTIFLIILKLDFTVKISWLWVLSPLWLPIIIFILSFLVTILIVTVQTLIEVKREKKEKENGKE